MSTILAPQKLYLMQLSRTRVPIAGGNTLDMISGCYLIEMSDGAYILVDSGLPDDVPPPPGAPQAEEQKSVIAHLAGLGIDPERITMLICTHFDVDHAGYHDAFPHAEFVVQRQHYELARQGHPRYAAARAHWDHPLLHYRLVEGDVQILPGITLLQTDGHAPGHQSVLVRLPKTGPVLLAVDAVVMERLFTTERQVWPLDDNQEQLRTSTGKLLEIVEQENVTLVVFGHDGQQWQKLTRAPQYYD